MMKESQGKLRQSCNQVSHLPAEASAQAGGSDNLQHSDLTRRIIGCAMQVHSTLGNGFQEVIYQRALEIEMKYAGLKFEREKEMPIFYRDENIGTRRVDFFVENIVMVELKAVVKLEDVHLAQAMNYLESVRNENRVVA